VAKARRGYAPPLDTADAPRLRRQPNLHLKHSFDNQNPEEEEKMKNWIGALALVAMGTGTALGYDNGPQSVGCDYRLGRNEGTAQCLILGSGMNQGVSWVVFEVQRQRFRYQSSSPRSIDAIDKSGNTIGRQRVSNTSGQCRPGGRSADIYAFDNGDRVCLYW
jgi:hypothetical protein